MTEYRTADDDARLAPKGEDAAIAGHAHTAARASQFLDYAFYLIYGLLAIRLVLALIGSRSSNTFVRFIGTITDPLYFAFRGIVGSPEIAGYTLVVPIIIALLVYAVLHIALNGLLRMVGTRKTAI
jgi:uncharacterized protein YggT (Ycf19 family)